MIHTANVDFNFLCGWLHVVPDELTGDIPGVTLMEKGDKHQGHLEGCPQILRVAYLSSYHQVYPLQRQARIGRGAPSSSDRNPRVGECQQERRLQR